MPVLKSIDTFATISSIGPAEIKEYCNKTDKHVDELEEDIEFLDHERINHANTLSDQKHEIAQLQFQIDHFQSEMQAWKDMVKGLWTQVNLLENKIDEKICEKANSD